MNRLFAILFLAFGLTACASDRVTITLTITNLPVAAQTLTVNASTRTWRATAATPATEITIGADIGEAATNLFRQLSAYQLSSYPALNFSSSNVITIKGQPGQAMSASVSAAYAAIAYTTNTVSAMDIVRTEGNQTINGTKTFTGQVDIQGGGTLDGVTITNAAGIYAPSGGVIDIGGTAVIQGQVFVTNSAPFVGIWQTDGASDEKYSRWKANGTTVSLELLSDLGLLLSTPIQITQSAGLVSAMTLTATNTTISGATLHPRLNHTGLANGNNAAADFAGATFVKIKAGPTAAFAICGIAGGANGRVLTLYNATGQNMTIANDSGVEPTAANRIYTNTGADLPASTGNSAVTLVYDSEDSRWVVVSVQN